MSDTTPHAPLTVTVPASGFARAAAIAAIKGGQLAEAIAPLAAGPFGLSAGGVTLLELLVDAVDVGIAAAEGLKGVILESQMQAGSFTLPTLAPPQARLIGALQLVVTADEVAARVADRFSPPIVEGSLELDGLDELLGDGAVPADLARRVAVMTGRYVQMKARTLADADRTASAAAHLVAAFVELLRRAVL